METTLPERMPPEIQRVNLAPVTLQLKALGCVCVLLRLCAHPVTCELETVCVYGEMILSVLYVCASCG